MRIVPPSCAAHDHAVVARCPSDLTQRPAHQTLPPRTVGSATREPIPGSVPRARPCSVFGRNACQSSTTAHKRKYGRHPRDRHSTCGRKSAPIYAQAALAQNQIVRFRDVGMQYARPSPKSHGLGGRDFCWEQMRAKWSKDERLFNGTERYKLLSSHLCIPPRCVGVKTHRRYDNLLVGCGLANWLSRIINGPPLTMLTPAHRQHTGHDSIAIIEKMNQSRGDVQAYQSEKYPFSCLVQAINRLDYLGVSRCQHGEWKQIKERR